MGLIDTLKDALLGRSEARNNPPLSFQEWLSYFSFNGTQYGLPTTMGGNREEVEGNFRGLVTGALRSNGIIFACMLARQLLFSEARFQFRQRRSGRPGDLFGNESLSVLEKPWPGGTTADLLSRAIQDADLAGTAFFVGTRRDRIRRARPDWVTMVLGSPYADADDLNADDIEAELLGIIYHPGGIGSGRDTQNYRVEDLAVFAPLPDPAHPIRGMSWMTPIIREIEADTTATTHKLNYFDKGATVNLVVQTGINEKAKFDEWVQRFRDQHEGARNAYRTLFLTPGADAKPIGSTLAEAEFKISQGAGETRIAAASGMHPVIVGLSEGLQGSSLNAGNFMAARRLVADKVLRPMWRNFAGSMSTIVPPPAGSELWYDDRDIPFLAEDVKDAAEVQRSQSQTIQQLVNAGYKPDAVIAAVTAGDFELLVGQHTGLYSVQLQPPTNVTPQPTVLTNGQAGEAQPAEEAIPDG